MKKKLQYALNLLCLALINNSIAHDYVSESQNCYRNWDYFGANKNSKKKYKHYWIKGNAILWAISLIKKYNLPIKYWWGKDECNIKNILYFSYNNEQISFHYFGSFRWIKKYKWNWKWVKNKNKNLESFKI